MDPCCDDILVTAHALDAQAERCAEQLTVSEIKAAVQTAIRDGRWSTRKPAWLGGAADRRPHRSPHETAFFVWPADESRGYVVENRGARLVVVTVLIPNPASPFRVLLSRVAV